MDDTNTAPNLTRAGHIARARALKVARIVAKVPAGATAEENGYLADELASWDQPCRDRWAASAGAKQPSGETWAAVVAAVRARPTALQTLAQREVA